MSKDPRKLEEGSKPEPSKVHSNNGTISVVKHQLTCLGGVKKFVGIILLCVAALCLTPVGGIVLVPCLLITIIVSYHKAMVRAIENKRYLLVNVIAMILDPFFFYIPVLNDEKKCISWDKTLGITATVLRFVVDFLKLIHMVYKLRTEYDENNQEENFNDLWLQFKNLIMKGNGDLIENATARKWMLFLIDILVILPIPQVLVIFGIRGRGFSVAMTFFVIQFSLRVIRTYFLFTHATEGILADATWSIFTFYLLLYLQSGHMFGALWYYYAIEKATDCWRKACKIHTGCSSRSSFSCNRSFREYNFLNDFCNISRGSTANYSFGIYNDALESGIVGETDFPKKLLRCLRWGLQNLSAFGQNLQTSTDVGENIFAICLTNYGVVLFVFLIGRMQSDTTRSQKINQKWQAIKQSKLYKNISGHPAVRRKFREVMREKLLNKHVDVRIDRFISDLSDKAAKQVKSHVGRDLLKQVDEFKNWDAFSLDYLCGCLKPVFFSERTAIIREGDPINEMVFVLHGKTLADSDNLQITRQRHQEDCNVHRQELIEWAKNANSYQQPPISSRTIRALTNVEAFTLKSDDLKCALCFRPIFNASAALIQLFWRFRKQKHANDKNAKPKSCLDRCFRK